MGLSIGIGTSRNPNSYQAGKEASRIALEKIEGKRADCAIVLASAIFNPEELLKAFKESLPGIPLVGCSTSGEILSSGPQSQSVIVLTMSSDSMKFTMVKTENISKDIKKSGVDLAQQVQKSGKAKLAIIFSDPLAGNGTEFVRGMFSVLGATFPLVGGAAGDDMNFKKTYQFFGDQVLTGATVGLAASGDFQCSIGADHGWQHIGNSRTVTKASGTTLYELDGKPAFEIYKDYFGERAKDFKSVLSLTAVTYPLGMKVKGNEKIMIRVPLGIGDDGSIVCGAEVLTGSQIFMMLGTIQCATSAAKVLAEKMNSQIKKSAGPKLVFLSNCVARKILLGDRGNAEIQAVRETFGPMAEVFGFYSYGQIAPFLEKKTSIDTCDPGYYEQSMAMAVLSD